MSSQGHGAQVTVLAFFTVNEDDPAAVARFQAAARALHEAVGARLVRRFRLSGPTSGARATWAGIVEYPDADAVRAVFETGAYERLGSLRAQAFPSLRIRTAANAPSPTLAAQLP